MVAPVRRRFPKTSRGCEVHSEWRRLLAIIAYVLAWIGFWLGFFSVGLSIIGKYSGSH